MTHWRLRGMQLTMCNKPAANVGATTDDPEKVDCGECTRVWDRLAEAMRGL